MVEFDAPFDTIGHFEGGCMVCISRQMNLSGCFSKWRNLHSKGNFS